MIYARPSVYEDIAPISANLRDCDVKEIWLSSKSNPARALKSGFILSSGCQTIMDGDNPIGMFGVAGYSAISKKGSIWLLATPEIEKEKIRFLRECKKVLPQICKGFDFVENHVDVQNTVTISWLRWLGFVMMEPEPYGPFGALFHKFYLEVKNV